MPLPGMPFGVPGILFAMVSPWSRHDFAMPLPERSHFHATVSPSPRLEVAENASLNFIMINNFSKLN